MHRLLALLAFGGLLTFQALSVHAADGDADNVEDEVDVCPTVADPFQSDIDGNGVGDLCEPDVSGVTTFVGTSGNDLVIGTSGDDSLQGAGGDDALYGLEGNDTLDGGPGNDVLVGGPGADTLTGGPGCDTFALDPAGDGDVITDYDAEDDRVTFPATAETDADPLAAATFGGDDHLVLTFGADGVVTAAFEFQGLPAGAQILLSGQSCPEEIGDEEVPPEEVPDDTEPPEECVPLFEEGIEFEFEEFDIELPFDGAFIPGTHGDDDDLVGTECGDMIFGDLVIEISDPEDLPDDFEDSLCPTQPCGNDVIDGLAANDLLVGDTIVLIEFDDGGDDTIDGGDGNDVIIGDALLIIGCECLSTEPGFLPGETGPVGGNDLLRGGDGNDVIFGDALAMIGPSIGGNDEIFGGNDNDLLFGDAIILAEGAVGGDDVIFGGDGNDVLIGDAFMIDEFSTGGNDILIGGAGDDILIGDAVIRDGVAGADTFHFDAAFDFGNDTIVDAGAGEVADTISVSYVSTIAELDARSTVTDDGLDVLAVVFTDASKVTQVGSITIVGIGGSAIASWADIDGLPGIDVVVVP